jgi:hypothetical protein
MSQIKNRIFQHAVDPTLLRATSVLGYFIETTYSLHSRRAYGESINQRVARTAWSVNIIRRNNG